MGIINHFKDEADGLFPDGEENQLPDLEGMGPLRHWVKSDAPKEDESLPDNSGIFASHLKNVLKEERGPVNE